MGSKEPSKINWIKLMLIHKGDHMKTIAIVLAFVASAAFANQPADETDNSMAETSMTETSAPAAMPHAKAHSKAHGKAMKMEKKSETATTANAGCSKEDAKAGKCKPEMTK